MSDIPQPVPFRRLLSWIIEEYRANASVFGIPSCSFFSHPSPSPVKIFSEPCDSPIGPAAGPHTQLAQNIAAAYMSGARFFELKTVQILDSLSIPKPCIDPEDECYNTEWSTELSVPRARDEYIKAWCLVHLLHYLLYPSAPHPARVMFTMSVGYDLAGIQSAKITEFIENLRDARHTACFTECLDCLRDEHAHGSLRSLLPDITTETLIHSISPCVSSSITLSTMHGCPPREIEAICRYLLDEKKLSVSVKLNPTLLGFDRVRTILDTCGFSDCILSRDSFDHDLQYDDALAMLRRLHDHAARSGPFFGVKLSNTLGVQNNRAVLPGNEMYLSGRALFPLTVALCARIADDFNGSLPMSFSGGATAENCLDILRAGIKPVTLATDLLKPGGYARLRQIAERVFPALNELPSSTAVDAGAISRIAQAALSDNAYQKAAHPHGVRPVGHPLPLFDCFVAPCRSACPINQDIPEYIRLVELQRYPEALECILSRNPLPHITGYICDHQCLQGCTRIDYDDPVCIRDLKLVAAESGWESVRRSLSKPSARNDVAIAVIGAGPAGLSAAWFLARAGCTVAVFDKESSAGGTVRNVIPAFRLPAEAIDKDISLIADQGVSFHFDQTTPFSLSDFFNKGFSYICIAIGAGNSQPLKLEGDNPHVYTAIDFLWHCKGNDKGITLGCHVAVIGGGNSAMDGARAALRVPGVETVYILYRRTREFMPADKEEFDNAIKDGVVFRELLNPVTFSRDGVLHCQVMSLGPPDHSGRPRPLPVENLFEDLPVDTVLSAIGESVDIDLLKQNNISCDGKNVLYDPASFETSVHNVFIGGDARRGPATVVEAIADGRSVAEEICTRAGIRFPAAPPVSLDAEAQRADAHAKHGFRSPAIEPLDSMTAASSEARRCLACSSVCEKCVQVCPNRANIAIHMPDTAFSNVSQILHLDALCNECGACQTFCPWLGAPYKDKLTLFWSGDAYNNSANPGFYFSSQSDNPEVHLRLDSHEFMFIRDTRDTLQLRNTTVSHPQLSNSRAVIAAVLSDYSYLLPSD